ncbi:MAG: TonB-dependent receptor [Chitinophagales bacterium]
MRIILFIVFIFFYNTHAYTQQCNLSFSGFLTDVDDNEKLAFAAVYLVETNQGTTSDVNGYFKIDNICSGTYTLRIKHIYCADVTDTLVLTESVQINYSLNHQDNLLDDITVHAERTSYSGTANTETLDAKELEFVKGKSLGEALKEINGLTSLQTGPSISKPAIHGLHSYRLLIMNNGVRQESQQWGSEHGPEIDPFIASNITVIKGAQSVKYGSDAIGGVILVDPAFLPDSAGVTGKVNFVGFSNNYGGALSSQIEGRLNQLPAFAWRLQGTYKFGGNTKTPNYYLANTAYREGNFSSALHFDRNNFETEVYYSFYNTKVGIFSGSHIGNVTDLLVAFESDTPLIQQDFTYQIGRPYQLIQHHLLKSTSALHTSSKGKFNFTVALQNNYRSEYDADRPLDDSLAALNNPSLYFDIGSITGNLDWKHPIKNNFSGSIGIDFINQQNISKYSYFIPNFRSYAGGLYVIEQYDFREFMFEVGLRYDYKWLEAYLFENSELTIVPYNFENISWNAGANYNINESCKFNLFIGSAWRAPSVSELYSSGLHHGAASLEFGNEDLNKEVSLNLQTGIELNNDVWFADAGVYMYKINDFIFLEPTLPPQLTIRGAFPVFYYKQTDANIYGLDATVKYLFPFRLQADARLSLLRARDVLNDSWIVSMPADRIGGGATYFFNTKNCFSELFIGTEVLHVFEQIRVPEEADYVSPPQEYTLFGMQVGTNLKMKHQTITLSIEGENMFNTTYRDYLNRFRYFADEMGRNITLRMKIPFIFKQIE